MISAFVQTTLSPHEYQRMRERVYDEQSKCCAGCGRKVLSVNAGELKRIKSGGDDSRANVEFICHTCYRKENKK